MKRLHFSQPNNLSQLHNALIAAIPGLRQVAAGPDGRLASLSENMRVEGRGNDIWITVPDTADEAAIAAVVNAHVPRVAQPPKLWADMTAAEQLEALRQRLGIA